MFVPVTQDASARHHLTARNHSLGGSQSPEWCFFFWLSHTSQILLKKKKKSLTAQTNNGWRELLEKNQTPDWLTWLCILRIKCSGIFLRFAIQLSQFPLSVLFLLLLLPQTRRSETAHFRRHPDGHGPPLPHDSALWLTASPGMWGTAGLVGG